MFVNYVVFFKQKTAYGLRIRDWSSDVCASDRVGALALLWNLVGVAAFVMQVAMPAEALGAMPAEQRAIYEATPAWLYVFYGLATFGGVAGSIGLLLRRRWAVSVYLVALVAL